MQHHPTATLEFSRQYVSRMVAIEELAAALYEASQQLDGGEAAIATEALTQIGRVVEAYSLFMPPIFGRGETTNMWDDRCVEYNGERVEIPGPSLSDEDRASLRQEFLGSGAIGPLLQFRSGPTGKFGRD